jgi:hypothetical protein
MPDEPQPKQFDIIAKVESLLEAPILSKLAAFAFYVEFVLRYFYGISLGDFATFAALRDFVIVIKPLSLALIAAGAALVPRMGLVTWRVLQALLFTPTHYFRKSESDKNYKLAADGFIMSIRRGKELARQKKDEYLLEECKRLEEEERKITVTKINVAAIFAITALNLILNSSQPGVGLILHGLAAQVAWLLVTGVYAGTYPPEHYDWVSVPEGYTEEEIHSSRFTRGKKLPVVAGKAGDERFIQAGEQPDNGVQTGLRPTEFPRKRGAESPVRQK